jgi:hypothetical protein
VEFDIRHPPAPQPPGKSEFLDFLAKPPDLAGGFDVLRQRRRRCGNGQDWRWGLSLRRGKSTVGLVIDFRVMGKDSSVISTEGDIDGGRIAT